MANQVLELTGDMAIIRSSFKPLPPEGEKQYFDGDQGILSVIYRSSIGELTPEQFKKEVERVFGS